MTEQPGLRYFQQNGRKFRAMNDFEFTGHGKNVWHLVEEIPAAPDYPWGEFATLNDAVARITMLGKGKIQPRIASSGGPQRVYVANNPENGFMTKQRGCLDGIVYIPIILGVGLVLMWLLLRA